MGAQWWTRDYVYTLGNTAAIDTADERMIHETATGTGKIVAWADDPFNSDPNEGAEWRHMLSFRANPTTGAAPFNRAADWDVDADGMPATWEMAHGLNPNSADNNGDFDSDGYTNLEEYINEITEWPAPQAIIFNGDTNNRYAQIANWDIKWQPSKYDEVQINSGTAAVDAVGQHAGVLKIASQIGNVAELNITNGWLLVDGAVVIGASASAVGTLHLSGGLLSTPLLTKGSAGVFQFTGGTLQADVIDFNLVNNGGTISPGQSPGGASINGSLQINSGAIKIELASPTSFDTILAAGSVTLGGDLHVQLLAGFVPTSENAFMILSGQTIAGSFTNLTSGTRVPVTGTTASFLVTTSNNQVTLSDFLTNVPGDYNNDGAVDAADFAVWRHSLATSEPLKNETASLDSVDAADYEAWRTNFGATMAQGDAFTSAVPEPSPNSMFVLSVLAWMRWTRLFA